ncbi:MAG: ABC transporter ATP-binding protein [Candidatus Omnitrophica bacterium]|nr:ABC transporter ATP-binding protein [Candidatus Omnitrophota bacterium]
MIKAHNISKKFRTRHSRVDALKNVSLQIDKGDFVSITGPSGSGKSTLLLTLGGMSAPHEGQVIWKDESVYDWGLRKRAEWRAKTVGFMFQTFNLIPYLSVFENVAIAERLSGKQAVDTDKIVGILERMKLGDRLEHLPRELSVGQQQRVAMARALVKDPQLILADEPTGNLDPKAAAGILDILREINNEGKTVVLITHDPHTAGIAKRNIRIEDGQVCQ